MYLINTLHVKNTYIVHVAFEVSKAFSITYMYSCVCFLYWTYKSKSFQIFQNLCNTFQLFQSICTEKPKLLIGWHANYRLIIFILYSPYTYTYSVSIVCDLNQSYNLKITSYFSFTETVFEQSSSISLPGIDNCLQ